MTYRKNQLFARSVCFGIGFVCVFVGLVHIFATLLDVSMHTEVPPILFLGILWLLFAFLLSREGTVRRFGAFFIGIEVISFFPMVLVTALFRQGPLLVAISVGVWVGSAAIAARLAFPKGKRDQGTATQAT